MKRARQEDWTTHPLPEKYVVLRANWAFSHAEAERMRRGLIPEVMEDKWFIYAKDGWLNFHRSWTGFCVYEVELLEAENGLRMGEIRVSRDLEQYRETNADSDLRLLRYLIDRLLLGKDVAFPTFTQDHSPVESAIFRHSAVGHAAVV